MVLANADAERTLLRVKQKLEGVEAGERRYVLCCAVLGWPGVCHVMPPPVVLAGLRRQHVLCFSANTGEGEARGVGGQVQQLLADAQDPDKLCRLYIGWQAWC